MGQRHWPCPISRHLDERAWLRTHYVVVVPLLNHNKDRGDDVCAEGQKNAADCGGIIWRSVCTVSPEDPPYAGRPCSNGNLQHSKVSFFKGNISIKIDIISSDIILLML